MKDEYWLLLVYSFLLLVAVFLVGLPVLSLGIGLVVGFIALAVGAGTPEYNPWGDFFVNSSKFFWHYWWAMIILSAVLAIGFLKLAKYLRKRR